MKHPKKVVDALLRLVVLAKGERLIFQAEEQQDEIILTKEKGKDSPWAVLPGPGDAVISPGFLERVEVISEEGKTVKIYDISRDAASILGV